MPVVGFSITRIEAERGKEAISPQMNINSAPTVKDIKEIDLDALKKKALQVDFDFDTNYSPNIGSIKLSGELFYVADDQEKILDGWKNSKRIPEEASLEILNFLFRRCILKMLNISDDLQLPPPINLPFVRPTQQSQGRQQEAKTQKAADEPEEQKEKELKEKIKKLTSK